LDSYVSLRRYRARHELIKQMAPRYRAASRTQKSRMLAAVVGVTGYARTYAIQLFNQTVEQKPRMQRPHHPHYGPEVRRALILAWTAANQICAKRLIPFMPTLVEALERHGHLQLTEEYRDQLLEMSAATKESSCNRLFSAVPSVAPLLFQTPLLRPSASFL
jgi:hypothetical protein